MLPEDRVLLLTSAGVLLVHAPGFAQLDGAAEIGAWRRQELRAAGVQEGSGCAVAAC